MTTRTIPSPNPRPANVAGQSGFTETHGVLSMVEFLMELVAFLATEVIVPLLSLLF